MSTLLFTLQTYASPCKYNSRMVTNRAPPGQSLVYLSRLQGPNCLHIVSVNHKVLRFIITTITYKDVNLDNLYRNYSYYHCYYY